MSPFASQQLSLGLIFVLVGQAQAISLLNPATRFKLSRLNKGTIQPNSIESAISAAAPSFPQYNFTQPLDHFADTGFTFQQRYWVDDRYYKPGGPVIVLDSGESSGTGRLPYLQQGVVQILANATGGLGIVLEHRYYGKSVPVANFTTDSLRCVCPDCSLHVLISCSWLNNKQAFADSGNFMANVKVPGISTNITAPGTPWIYYGVRLFETLDRKAASSYLSRDHMLELALQ